MIEQPSQKGLTTNIAIIIVVAVALVAGGISYYAYTGQKQAQDEEQSALTANIARPTPKKPTILPVVPTTTLPATPLVVALSDQNSSGESGSATLNEINGQVQVVVNVNGESATANQPAHIHVGACPNPGAPIYPLNPVVGGNSTTIIAVSMDALLKQLPLAINIHKSDTEIKTYMACGDIVKSKDTSAEEDPAVANPSTGNIITGALENLADKSLDEARAKARDAKRISELKQFSVELSIANSTKPNATIPCVGMNPIINSINCSAIALGNTIDWNQTKDPAVGNDGLVKCGNATPTGTSCAYTIKSGSTMNKYEICFATEQTTNLGVAGVYNIKSGGIFSSGCSF